MFDRLVVHSIKGGEAQVKKLIFLSAMFLCFVLLAAGCAKPPVEEMEAAKTSMDMAMQAEADKYAPNELKAAKKKFEDGKTAVEAKNYKSAKSIFMETKDMADGVVKSAKANKEKMKAEVGSLMPEAESLFENAKSLARKKYPSSTYRKLKIAEKRALVDSLEKLLAEAKADFKSAKYHESKTKFTDIKAKSGEIIASIQGKK